MATSDRPGQFYVDSLKTHTVGVLTEVYTFILRLSSNGVNEWMKKEQLFTVLSLKLKVPHTIIRFRFLIQVARVLQYMQSSLTGIHR